MTVPAPPVPAEKSPRRSAAGIALRVAGALLALAAGLMVIGIIGSMAQGNLGAGGAVVDVILLVGLPGALAAGLFWWAGRLDQRAADRAASAPAASAPRPAARIAPVQAPSVQEPEPPTAAPAPAPEPATSSRPSSLSSIEVPMFGRKKRIVELEARLAQETRERARLQEFVDSHGGPQIWDQEKILEDLRRRIEEQEAELAAASARIERRKQEEAAEVRRVAEQTRAEEQRRTEELRADIDRLQQEKAGLGADIERRKQEEAAEVRRVAEQTRAEEQRRTEELRADIDRLQQEKAGLGADIERRKQEEAAEVRRVAEQTRAEEQRRTEELRADIDRLQREEAGLQERLHPMRVQVKLDEAGFTDYDNPAKDSVGLGAELRDLRKDVQMAVRNYSAISSAEEITVPTTKAGRGKLSRDTAKLALTAFNSQVDTIIEGATARNYEAALGKIHRIADTIERLGASSSIRISPDYIEMRTRELLLAVQHLQAKQTERELERERKAELREQARAERELEAERERLEKEKQHYLNVLKVVQDTGDQEETARLKEELVAIEKGINDVEERTANIRAGYVYVISNIGAFGDRMVKIGMTRRLDPMDRVRELGDASVPFGFDVHALFFSDDAVTLEADLHRRFADKRVNRINTRREFFYATPAQVRDALSQIAGNLLEFTDEPEAEQYRLSLQMAAEEAQKTTPPQEEAEAPVADRTEQDPDEDPQN